MRRILALAPAALAATAALAAALAIPALPALAAPPAQNEVAVVPNPVQPGHTVTLKWYFTGKKVVLSGGRFGKGVVVTGRTSITDRPTKTTRYTFQVWYTGLAPDKATGKMTEQSLHSTYTAVAEMEAPLPNNLTTYRDSRGWQISHLKGWKHDSVSYPDPANNALIFFQKDDDSVERVAVSMLPAESMTCTDLMSKVQKSLYNNYDEVQVLSDQDCTCCGSPAVLSVFTGIDHTHPGTHTQSLVLALVKDGHAYVISARANAGSFAARRPLLERMVKSFTMPAAHAAK